MDEVYISQWEALQCFEDWEDSSGRFYWAHDDVTYQAIEKLPPADVIPVEWILKQDGGDELVNRWNEYKEECPICGKPFDYPIDGEPEQSCSGENGCCQIDFDAIDRKLGELGKPKKIFLDDLIPPVGIPIKWMKSDKSTMDIIKSSLTIHDPDAPR